MVKPIYSLAAKQSRVSGQVIVEVELDPDGNVARAKTISGHPYLRKNSEDAARQSKFKPAMYENAPAKGKGTLVYNFVPAATQ